MVASGGQLLKSWANSFEFNLFWRTEMKDHRHLLFASIRKPGRQKKACLATFSKGWPPAGPPEAYTIIFLRWLLLTPQKRGVQMKKLFLSIMFLVFTVSNSMAAVLTFDDVVGADPTTDNNSIYNGYGGFDWDMVYVVQKDLYPDSGYEYGVVSGEWVAFNAWDYIATVNDDLFDFNGAYFTSAWDSVNELTANGFLDGTLIFTQTYTINNQSPTWLQFDFIGIDSLTFATSGQHFAMDNFTFNETQPVPEPATMFLLGAGLLGGVVSRKRKKN